jgi:hypothetical protein
MNSVYSLSEIYSVPKLLTPELACGADTEATKLMGTHNETDGGIFGREFLL